MKTYKLLKKLKSRKGETLVEVMVSIVIGLFSCILLTQVISTSTNMDSNSRATFSRYYDDNNRLMKAYLGEAQSGMTAQPAFIQITDDNGNLIVEKEAEYFENSAVSGQKVIIFREK